MKGCGKTPAVERNSSPLERGGKKGYPPAAKGGTTPGVKKRAPSKEGGAPFYKREGGGGFLPHKI